MKALVTGGGGFIGRYIVEQLCAEKNEVIIFARNHYPQSGVQSIQGDLQDLQSIQRACQGIDAVFHVAAKPGIWGTWDSFYNPNVIGTYNVIAACQKQRVAKLIFTSSPSVIFNNQPQQGCDESLPYPRHYENIYSETKAMAEQAVIAANGPDLLTVCLRPHLVWGPRDPNLLPRVIARARAGKLVQVGTGTNKVDITYVEDAARAHLLACKALKAGSATAGQVYFISQDDPVILWSWFNNLLTLMDIPPVKRKISLGSARLLAGVMESAYRFLAIQSEPPLTRFSASVLALDHYYNISKAKRDFGYQPQFSMDNALEKTLALDIITSDFKTP